jgi:hypothetical protein
MSLLGLLQGKVSCIIIIIIIIIRSRARLVTIATGWTDGEFSTAFRPTLESPIQGVQRPVSEVDHSAPSTAEVKNGGAMPTLTPIRLRHVVLN